jgi:hypothetical protein
MSYQGYHCDLKPCGGSFDSKLFKGIFLGLYIKVNILLKFSKPILSGH